MPFGNDRYAKSDLVTSIDLQLHYWVSMIIIPLTSSLYEKNEVYEKKPHILIWEISKRACSDLVIMIPLFVSLCHGNGWVLSYLCQWDSKLIISITTLILCARPIKYYSEYEIIQSVLKYSGSVFAGRDRICYLSLLRVLCKTDRACSLTRLTIGRIHMWEAMRDK